MTRPPDPVRGPFADFAAFCGRRDPSYPRGPNLKYACPCCGRYTLGSPGGYDICPVCSWEDDGTAGGHPFAANGDLTLAEARANYAAFGACEARSLRRVRPPRGGEDGAGNGPETPYYGAWQK